MSGVAAGIKQWADIMANREKIKGQIALNAFETKLNEAHAERLKQIMSPGEKQDVEIKNMLLEQYKKQNTEKDNSLIQPGQEVFNTPVKPQVELSGSGLKSTTPNPKAWALNLIQKKEALYYSTQDPRYKLTAKEQKFKDEFFGVGEGTKSNQTYIKAWSAAKSYLEKNDPEFALLPMEEQQAKLNETANEFYQQFQSGGASVANDMQPKAMPESSQKSITETTPEIESLISENMKAYGKTREEIVSALKAKGLI